MPIEKSKCRCRPGYKCSAPLHGEIVILNCEKNCGLGCDKPIKKTQTRNSKYE